MSNLKVISAYFIRINSLEQMKNGSSKLPWLLKPAWLQRSFNVVSANNANTRAAIQNRAMIFDSFHPSSSK
jgi:hypothetical protein